MTKQTLFDFDISVSADKKRRRRGSRRMSGAVETSTRVCEFPGCKKRGNYRAPRSPDDNDEFHWFCREHVQEFNHNWNYFKIHAEAEKQSNESSGEQAIPGQNQPEQRSSGEKAAWSRHGIEDPLEILGERGTLSDQFGASSGRRITAIERRALKILDARETWSRAEIKRQYASLIKDLHPDKNCGDRSDEDRLREVVWAWDQIKDSRNFQDG